MGLRDKTDEIVSQGRAKRGNFSPQPGSAPLRAYHYFYTISGSTPPEQENFCHFWRVVMLWAPLAWFTEHVLEPFSETRFARALAKPFRADEDLWLKLFTGFVGLYVVVMVGLLLAALITHWAAIWPTFLFIVAVVAIIAGTVAGFTLLTERRRNRRADEQWDQTVHDMVYDTKTESREPGRLAKIGSGTLDFLILIAQWIRTKKWKICPLVEIPHEVRD